MDLRTEWGFSQKFPKAVSKLGFIWECSEIDECAFCEHNSLLKCSPYEHRYLGDFILNNDERSHRYVGSSCHYVGSFSCYVGGS